MRNLITSLQNHNGQLKVEINRLKKKLNENKLEIAKLRHEGDPLNELRAILGNSVAVKAYREGTLPFPDGTILAKLAWKHVPSEEFEAASVPGAATTVQIMIKDAKKYAATGGWGFGRFVGGKPVDEAQHKTCFPCHEANVKGHDFVFTPLRALIAERTPKISPSGTVD